MRCQPLLVDRVNTDMLTTGCPPCEESSSSVWRCSVCSALQHSQNAVMTSCLAWVCPRPCTCPRTHEHKRVCAELTSAGCHSAPTTGLWWGRRPSSAAASRALAPWMQHYLITQLVGAGNCRDLHDDHSANNTPEHMKHT